jgi:hypothetical protein
VLRCAPGKARATVYDPHDLLATHGLTHAAALGDVPPTADDPDVVDTWPLFDLPPLRHPIPESVAVDAVGAWARAMVLAMELGTESDGLLRWGEGWRRNPATPGQVREIERYRKMTRYMPKEHRDIVNLLANRPGILRAGIASDLRDVLKAVHERTAPRRAALAKKGIMPWQRKAWTVDIDVPFIPKRVLKALEP